MLKIPKQRRNVIINTLLCVLDAVLRPEQNSLSDHLPSPDTLLSNPSSFPPPLPVKSRDLAQQEFPPLDPPHPEEASPEEAPPPLARSCTARVSFREPISSSYSVDEDEDEDESAAPFQEDQENQLDNDDQEEVEEEVLEEGGFGSRLRLQKGVPPQMDLLGEKTPLSAAEYFKVKCVVFRGETATSGGCSLDCSTLPPPPKLGSELQCTSFLRTRFPIITKGCCCF